MNAMTTTHWGGWDTLLVRVGGHLWRWHKADRGNKAITAAVENIWTVKREFRMPMTTNRETKRVRARQTLQQMPIGKALLTVGRNELKTA
jgi:hypothetical protein